MFFSVVEFGDDDVPGVKRVREHGHGFLVQNDADGPERSWLEAHLRFGSSRHSFVNSSRNFAVDQERIAAVHRGSLGDGEA